MAADWMNAPLPLPRTNRFTKIEWGQFLDRPHIFDWACQKGLEWQSKCGVFWMVNLLSAEHKWTTVVELIAERWMNLLSDCILNYLTASRSINNL